MPMFVAGLLLLWLSAYLLRGFLRANPAVMAAHLRKTGGWLALGFALFMLVRGEWNLAFGAAAFGFWLIGTRAGFAANPFAAMGAGLRARRRPAGLSQVRTGSLEMMLDHMSGRITGRCVAGPWAGRPLDSLSQADGVDLYRWCVGADPDGARLLETYFDRRFPRWRQAADDRTDAGGSQSGFGGQGPTRMSDRMAYQILGLAQGASREEITRAHRRLMKKYHPDHGGSTDMAAEVNEAKDVLMRRHP